MIRRRPRAILIASLLVAGLASAWHLGLDSSSVWPTAERWTVLGRFLRAAFMPTLTSQSDLAINIVPRTLQAMWSTVVFAVAAMSLSLVVGIALGVLASERWWHLFPPCRARFGWHCMARCER